MANFLTKLFCNHTECRPASDLELAWNLPNYYLPSSPPLDINGTVCAKCGKLLRYVINSKAATLYSDPMTMLQNMYKQDEKDSFNWYHC